MIEDCKKMEKSVLQNFVIPPCDDKGAGESAR